VGAKRSHVVNLARFVFARLREVEGEVEAEGYPIVVILPAVTPLADDVKSESKRFMLVLLSSTSSYA